MYLSLVVDRDRVRMGRVDILDLLRICVTHQRFDSFAILGRIYSSTICGDIRYGMKELGNEQT